MRALHVVQGRVGKAAAVEEQHLALLRRPRGKLAPEQDGVVVARHDLAVPVDRASHLRLVYVDDRKTGVVGETHDAVDDPAAALGTAEHRLVVREQPREQ